MHVTFEEAQWAVDAAMKKAEAIGTRMCIAVVDSGASLKAFARMNDAWVGSIDIAIKKAQTACFFGMPTGQIGKLSQPTGPLFGIEHSNGGLITFPGGHPYRGNWSQRKLSRKRPSCRRGGGYGYWTFRSSSTPLANLDTPRSRRRRTAYMSATAQEREAETLNPPVPPSVPASSKSGAVSPLSGAPTL